MMHLSTAYVFEGDKRLAYNENDETNPRGIYGASALKGEQAVRQHAEHLIIRPDGCSGNGSAGSSSHGFVLRSRIRGLFK